MKRNYLAVFLLPIPQHEHLQIVEVIRAASKGDFKQAFFGAFGGGYLFCSELHPWDLDFGKVLMNDDSLLIVELGEAFTHRNLRIAENWLKAHRVGK